MGSIFKPEGMSIAKQRERRLGVQQRAVHAGAMRLVQNHFPGPWDRVRKCRYDGLAKLDAADFQRATYKPYTCKQVPYCLPCTEARNHANAFKTMEKFFVLRPPDRPVRAIHVVMTAPLFHPKDGGRRPWGWRAREDLPRFRAFGIKMLEAMFGPGVSGVINYQDFGNQPFLKPHPHLDCVVNGYAWRQDKVVALDRPQLMLGGKAALQRRSVELAQALFLEADLPSNFNVGGAWLDEAAGVYNTLHYSNREMFDFANLEYKETPERVGWRAYDSNVVNWTKDIMAFWNVWDGYNRMFRPERALPWRATDEQRAAVKKVKLRTYFGAMAPKAFRFSAKLFGGSKPPHRRLCSCGECNEWLTASTDDAGNIAYRENGSPVLIV
ncbi:MAG: hypothetical protein HYT80_11160 [Euryarchaeota archaeon]|nr:hypothetical protein [Euryarchaeota archaeon]